MTRLTGLSRNVRKILDTTLTLPGAAPKTSEMTVSHTRGGLTRASPRFILLGGGGNRQPRPGLRDMPRVALSSIRFFLALWLSAIYRLILLYALLSGQRIVLYR